MHYSGKKDRRGIQETLARCTFDKGLIPRMLKTSVKKTTQLRSGKVARDTLKKMCRHREADVPPGSYQEG